MEERRTGRLDRVLAALAAGRLGAHLALLRKSDAGRAVRRQAALERRAPREAESLSEAFGRGCGDGLAGRRPRRGAGTAYLLGYVAGELAAPPD